MWSRETAIDGFGVGCLVITCLSNLGRVNSCPHQHTAQIDKAETVQLQCMNGRSSCGCQTNQSGEITAPCEVLVPFLAAGMKERYLPSTVWIDAGGAHSLFAIASAT